jgi:DNA uptake protein ComE-like DNA-binding protein
MKQSIRIWLRDFFGFSRTEANGFIILSLLMVLIILLPFITKTWFSSSNPSLQSEKDKIKLNALLTHLDSNVKTKKKEKKKDNFKYFDLNRSNVQKLANSGFPQFLAERIVKYRTKVKPFESKEELLKIYGIDSAFFKEIYPFIKVSKPITKFSKKSENASVKKISKNEPKTHKKESKKAKIQPFDINQSDSLKLQKIYGIGPAYSSWIIKYRDKLGGFHSLYQLEEVYGLKKENLDSLKQYIFIADSLKLRQLKVNLLNADSMVQHPYISYKEANLIVNYRNQHGDFKSAKGLLKIKILDSLWVKKVTPYISFD